jgi:hypothetical protein
LSFLQCGQIIYAIIDGGGWKEKFEESKHSDEDYYARTDEGSKESSLELGYVKEPPLILVLWPLCLQHEVSAEVQDKNDIKVMEE